MEASTVLSRYVTADFKAAPVLALAELMGFRGHELVYIENAPELYAPILTGLASHRHLSRFEQRAVNQRIMRLPVNQQDRYFGLLAAQRVQPFWFMWSLSDEEVRSFFEYNKATAQFTKQFNIFALSSITAGGVATAAYEVSQKGAKEAANDTARKLLKSPLAEKVAEMFAKRFSVDKKELAIGLGAGASASIIVISALNIMANKSSERAKRELIARGLLAYNEI